MLSLFQQLRDDIQLNKVNQKLGEETRTEVLMELKKGFFAGLIDDLLKVKGYQVAEIINGEMMKEDLEMDPEDYIVTLKIAAN